MAIVGVKKSFYAKYAKSASGSYAYSDGAELARLTQISVSYESNDSELYSDDELEESDYSFSKGTITLTTSELTDSAVAAIMGITLSGSTQNKELVFDDDMSQPELGIGFIITKKKGGTFSYRAIVFPRVKFKIPADAATTREGKLAFQTAAIEGTLSRDFSEKHVWKREQTFASESDAVDYIKTKLGISVS